MKKIVVDLLAEEVGLGKIEIENLVEVPPTDDLGDYAFPCFRLAKEMKKNPMAIAEDLAEKLRKVLPKEISNVDFNAGYVNFFVDKKILAEGVLKAVSKKGFGENDSGKGKKIVIDMSSPNIAKPFGIGHLRSTIIGNSIGKISEANGFEVVKINYLGDWGTQFGKILWAYKKWIMGKSECDFEKDPIGTLARIYVQASKYDNKKNKKDVDDMRAEFKKLEEGDVENRKLWEKFRKLSIGKFDEIYKMLGIDFDVISGESEYNFQMDAVVKELKKKKLAKEDEGAVIVDLADENLGVALIQKNDGTSLYATRDLAAAIDRKKKYNFDKLIYEVGQEQKLHFKQVFKILELMGNDWARDCVHVSHGLYLDSDGKKFSTRKGKTVYMKDVLDEVIEKAKKGLLEREELSEKELEIRARKIALAAIFYGDLKNYRENNMVFDVDKFLAFEGDTGPYLLYSYARASSILRKSKSKAKMRIVDLKDSEIRLLKKISSFPEIVKRACDSLAPNVVANYSYELASAFNEFYHDCPVLGGIEEGFRLKLVESFQRTLGKSLNLLGIEFLDEM